MAQVLVPDPDGREIRPATATPGTGPTREALAAALDALEVEATAVVLNALGPVLATITDHLLADTDTIQALTAAQLRQAHNPYHDEQGRFTTGPGGRRGGDGSGPEVVDVTPIERSKAQQEENPFWPKQEFPSEAAWRAITTDEAKALADAEATHPERYDDRGWLREGEVRVRHARPLEGGPARLHDMTPIPEGTPSTEWPEGWTSLPSGQRVYPVPGSERPPQHVYRVMSVGEYDQAMGRGYFRSDERHNLGDEGTVASLKSTGEFYVPLDGSDYRIVRIDYDDADGWQSDPVDQYIKTHSEIPFSRVSATTPPMRNPKVTASAYIRLNDWVESLRQAHNPYHDEQGRFTTGPGGASGGGYGRTFDSRQDEYDYGMQASETWRSNLNETGRRGVERYAKIGGGEWRAMNQALRGQRPPDAETDVAIEELDEAFYTSGAELADDLTLHRGMSGQHTNEFYEAHRNGTLVGTTIKNPGYSSTTMNQERADRWAHSTTFRPMKEPPLVLEIRAPKGTPAIFPGDLSAHPMDETEWVLPRGLDLEVIDAYEDSSRMVRDDRAMHRRNDFPMLRVVVRPVL